MMRILAIGLAMAFLNLESNEPEDTAKAVAEMKIRHDIISLKHSMEEGEWRIACLEKEMGWWADRGKIRKEIEQIRAKVQFFIRNLEKIEKSFSFDLVDIRQPDPAKPDVREITIKFMNFRVKEGEHPGDYYLDYESEKWPLPLIKVGDDWKVQDK